MSREDLQPQSLHREVARPGTQRTDIAVHLGAEHISPSAYWVARSLRKSSTRATGAAKQMHQNEQARQRLSTKQEKLRETPLAPLQGMS